MNTVFQVITLAWSLQGGQYFGNAINDAGVFSTNDNYFFQTEFEFQIPFSWEKGGKNMIFIGAETESQFAPHPGRLQFSPWQDAFTFNAGVRVIGIELGYQHQCIHPVVVQDRPETSKYFSGFDKIYAKVSGSF